MAEKRRDSRGIVLNTGESQLSNGRYRYRYYDERGLPHEVTSMRLRPNDPMPDGKKPCKSLREMEKEITKQLEDGLKVWESGMTVNQLVREYMDKARAGWEITTQAEYERVYKNRISSSAFGKKKASKVSPEDVEQYYLSLCADMGLMVSTLGSVDRLINPAFKMAVKKRMIPTNPATGAYGSVKRTLGGGAQKQKHALEQDELENLLQFILDKYPAWYPLYYFLAWTGCRIGEALGLAWQNVDFQNEVIHITKTMEYFLMDGKYQSVWKEPKTEAGIREIPMLGDLKRILLELRPERKVVSMSKEATLEDIVFLGVESGRPLERQSVGKRLNGIIDKYNESHENQLPDISPHTFRHTFTCWLVENFSSGEHASLLDNLKYIQQILGHSDASTTLNVYAELRKDKLKEKHELLKKASQG